LRIFQYTPILTHFNYGWLDYWVAACLVPVVVWILLSGLDDLFINVVYLLTCRRRFPWPVELELRHTPERRIAIFVPVWHEHGVIGQMLEHNLAEIGYSNYDVFVGVYPNDLPTVRAVSEQSRRHPRIHVATCPHNGPTSKGDCMNWIYRRMQEFEALHGVRFKIVVTHDAEDLVHSDSLRLINWFSRNYEMVQIPVLPLPTGLRDFTHGLYCDEFAEYQHKDIPVRQRLGGFLPANGVGTGFDRASLDRLASTRQGRVFDPECLTEDYETGFRLHALGCRQIFVPVHFAGNAPVATREYFPRSFRTSVRQRTRWVTGIALQGWQHHGWRGRQVYWFWRDRKGLVGNLLSPVANLLFLCGLASFLESVATARPWQLRLYVSHWMSLLCYCTLGLSWLQAGLRAHASARIYGWRFATGVPVRMFWGNLVNSAATAAALYQFAVARIDGRTLAWRKTEHIYPMPQLCDAISEGIHFQSVVDVSSTSATRESYSSYGPDVTPDLVSPQPGVAA
jgi:adsorption protein B